MPPPSAPSSTPSAQELRTSAKQIVSQRPDERSENKSSRSASGEMRPPSRPSSRPPSRGPTHGPAPSPGRRRSPSPSRGAQFDNRLERPGEGDRSDRISSRTSFPPRQDRIPRTGMEADRIDRGLGERPGVSSSRDPDRIRDPDRDRDRERDRERERERDRHRRDWDKDKGRDLNISRSKDREAPVGREPSLHPRRDPLAEEVPTGPDLSRRSFSGGTAEDHLGKRRRGADDEVSITRFEFDLMLIIATQVDRGSKRSARHKDPAYRDERPSRHKSERERERPRESERRRRDREPDNTSQGDGRNLPESQERVSVNVFFLGKYLTFGI